MVLVRFSSDWRICSWKISTFFFEAALRPLASVKVDKEKERDKGN